MACEAAGALLISLFQVIVVVVVMMMMVIVMMIMVMMMTILIHLQAGTPLWEVEVAITSLCIVLEIEAVEVCEGMVHNYGYQVRFVVFKVAPLG